MTIASLYIKNFRNYSRESFHFNSGLNFITGKNGIGKTNIIESVSVLSSIKSFRGVKDRDLVKNGEYNYYIKGVVGEEDTDITFEAAFSREESSKLLKRFKIDGEIINRVKDYYGRFLTICIAPHDLFLVNGTPEEKRRYIDSVISKVDSSYIQSLHDYKKILENRNTLLKKTVHKSPQLIKNIAVWNRMLAEKSVLISQVRHQFLKSINDSLSKYYSIIGNEDISINLSYRSNVKERSEKEIAVQYENDLDRDVRFGNTLTGVHRDSYTIDIDGIDIVTYASQGQKRTTSLAIKLCEKEIIETKRHKKCVILIDDIFSELDKNRRNNLINLVYEDNQTIFTVVDVELIDTELINKSKVFNLE